MDNMNDQQPMQQVTSGNDAEKNKAFAIIGYIIPILFFIPMLSEEGKKSQFAMFHANQQLLLLIGWIVSGFLTFLLIGFLLYFVMLVFMIIGIINAAQGAMKPIPLIGNIKILH